MSSSCKRSHSCPKLARKNKCTKSFKNALPTKCEQKISKSDLRKKVKDFCVKSCKAPCPGTSREDEKRDVGAGTTTAQNKCILRGNERCRPLKFIEDESKYDPNCCSPAEPCGLGDGGCTTNEDCLESLVCGHGNCGITGASRCCATLWESPGLVSL